MAWLKAKERTAEDDIMQMVSDTVVQGDFDDLEKMISQAAEEMEAEQENASLASAQASALDSQQDPVREHRDQVLRQLTTLNEYANETETAIAAHKENLRMANVSISALKASLDVLNDALKPAPKADSSAAAARTRNAPSNRVGLRAKGPTRSTKGKKG
jgi:chromosome segregation ATPase